MALCRIIELTEPQALLRQPVHPRCFNLGSVTPEIAVSKIIYIDQDDVGLAIRGYKERWEKDRHQKGKQSASHCHSIHFPPKAASSVFRWD